MNYILNLTVCDKDLKRAEGTIKPSSKVELKFLASDGEYNLVLNDGVDTTRKFFSYYGNTIRMIVNNIEKICGTLGCSCKDTKTVSCKDDIDSCNILLQPLVMSLGYYFLDPVKILKYNKTLAYLSTVLNCNITQLLSCIVSINSVTGKASFKDLAEQLSVVFYTLFYVDAILSSESEEEEQNVKTLYKVAELQECIRKFGIDLETIFDNLISKDTMKVYFWQQDLNSQETIEDIDFNLTQELLYTHSYKTIDLFLQGVIVPFNSLGKIVFVVNNTLDLDYQIEDFLGNDITDMFEKIYNVGLNSTIFLSRSPYSTSDIYFKFKQKFLSNG